MCAPFINSKDQLNKEKEDLKGLLLQCYIEMQRSNKIIGYQISQEFLDKIKDYITPE